MDMDMNMDVDQGDLKTSLYSYKNSEKLDNTHEALKTSEQDDMDFDTSITNNFSRRYIIKNSILTCISGWSKENTEYIYRNDVLKVCPLIWLAYTFDTSCMLAKLPKAIIQKIILFLIDKVSIPSSVGCRSFDRSFNTRHYNNQPLLQRGDLFCLTQEPFDEIDTAIAAPFNYGIVISVKNVRNEWLFGSIIVCADFLAIFPRMEFAPDRPPLHLIFGKDNFNTEQVTEEKYNSINKYRTEFDTIEYPGLDINLAKYTTKMFTFPIVNYIDSNLNKTRKICVKLCNRYEIQDLAYINVQQF